MLAFDCAAFICVCRIVWGRKHLGWESGVCTLHSVSHICCLLDLSLPEQPGPGQPERPHAGWVAGTAQRWGGGVGNARSGCWHGCSMWSGLHLPVCQLLGLERGPWSRKTRTLNCIVPTTPPWPSPPTTWNQQIHSTTLRGRGGPVGKAGRPWCTLHRILA